MEEKIIFRASALHAITYCERLFFLQHVEDIANPDERVYAGRTMHETEVDKNQEWKSIELESEVWGIRGKVDFARYRDGRLIAVEHKKGRAKGDDAWETDKLQVVAYAVLLEEHFGTPVTEGRIRYHANNKTVRVAVDDAAKQKLAAAIARARELSLSLHRPPVTDNENLCAKCSLAPVCLPEEERLAAAVESAAVEGGAAGAGKKKVRRFFPQHDERRVLHILEKGSQVRRSGLQFVVSYPDEREDKKIPGKDVGAFVLHGGCQITTQAIQFAVSEDIAVHWLTGGGHYVGGVAPAAGVQRRLRQYRALGDKALCLTLARRLVAAKVENQMRFIARSSRTRDVRSQVEADLKAMQLLAKEVEGASSFDALRGFEGNIARYYFSALSCLTSEEETLMAFDGRNRRPPQDAFNAALSFGYSLLYRDMMAAIISVGLDSTLGFFHTPRSAAHPLALDLMELFRVIMWDIALVASVNRRQWKAENFVVSKKLVWLSDEGKRQAISLYESRKQETWKHPVLGYSLSYARTMELEVRLLEKEWNDNEGVFAQLRLR